MHRVERLLLVSDQIYVDVYGNIDIINKKTRESDCNYLLSISLSPYDI